MKTVDFDYYLPEELIAQSPIEPRDDSRLLVLDRSTGDIDHKIFYEIIDYFEPGDCLVLNDTKVLPARLFGKIFGKGTLVEFLLLKDLGNNMWETLVKPGKKAKTGTVLEFKKDTLYGKIENVLPNGNRVIKFLFCKDFYSILDDMRNTSMFSCIKSEAKNENVYQTLYAKKEETSATSVVNSQFDESLFNRIKTEGAKISDGKNFYSILDDIGAMPVPHYIKSELRDKNRYQTVYAKERGSSAAPTAGLHFTEELLSKIEKKGVKIAKITLHVGLGTFRPVKAENIEEHKMHTEWYTVPKESARLINEAKNSGKRVICVGTTSCRTLESVFFKHKKILECSGETDIFIYPGFKFNVMDALITNFHLPKSTLIMLVCAFAGKSNIMNAYRLAVEKKYRFFSFGDAMLII